MRYQRITFGVGLLTVAGGVGMDVVAARAGALFSTGLVTILLGVMLVGWALLSREFRAVTKPADDAYQLGFQVGFDRGYMEGRATARPVVVPMAGASTCLECDDRKRLEEHARRIDVRSETAVRKVAGNDPTA